MLKPVLPVFSYIINYNYIVKELCENKEKPQLHCNGKCHLKKELAKSSESEKPLSQKKLYESEHQLVFLQQLDEYIQILSEIPDNKISSKYSNLYLALYPPNVFRPPTV